MLERSQIHNVHTRLGSRQPLGYAEGGFQAGSELLNARLHGWLSIFTDLVQIPSESGVSDMDPILRRVEEFYSHVNGVTFQRIGDAAVITLPGRNISGIQQEPVLLCGHLDTVTPGTNIKPYLDLGEKGNPIVRSEGEEHILGADNKAAVAAIMNISRELIESGQDYAPTTIILTSDEETAGIQIAKVLDAIHPTARIGLILDKSDPIGDVVLGGYGYSRYDITLPNLESRDVLGVMTQIDELMGSHLVGRRQVDHQANHLVRSVNTAIRIDKISVPNKSRNTVPEAGKMEGTIVYNDIADATQVIEQLTVRVSAVGGTLQSQRIGNEIKFTLSFRGFGGHAKRDDLTTVVGDIADVARFILDTTSQQQEIQTKQKVRLNVAGITTTRRGERLHLNMKGEARYQDSTEAAATLGLVRGLVEACGGKMNIVEENKSYQLKRNDPAVIGLIRILRANGIKPNVIKTAASMSDANNGTRPGLSWVVTSDGGLDAHSSRESYPVRAAVDIQNIIYDWMTRYRLQTAA